MRGANVFDVQCTGSRISPDFSKIHCACVKNFEQDRTGLDKFEQVRTGLDKFEQVRTGWDKFQQVWTSLNESEQV